MMTTHWDSAIELKRLIDLERKDAAGSAVDRVIEMLESHATNEQYRKAFKFGVELIRSRRETFVSETYTDNVDQITDTSEASR